MVPAASLRTPQSCFETLERRRLLSAATRVVEYDLIAGTQEVLDEGVRINADDSAALDASLRAEGFEGGLDALLASFGSPDDFTDMVDSLLAGDVHTGMSPTGDRVDFNDPTLYDVKDFDRSVSGADNRVRVTDTTQFPFSAVGRLATGCSGAMIGPYHFLTAGHCVLDFAGNPDPLSSLGVSLGRDGADRPFGEAEATFVRTYSEFAQGNQWEHDWAVITLDRSIGNYAGYFGYRHYEGNDALAGKPVTILQYPGDKPTGTQWRADGVIASQAQVNAWRTGSDYSTELKTFYNGTLDTAGGSSGSSVWEQLPGDEVPQVLAVHGYGFPSSQPNGFNSASRLDTRKITDIGLWKLADDAARPPVDFADLTVSATGSELTLPVGGQFTLSGAIRNTGTAIASDVEYSVYASTDDILGNSDDILLAQGTLDEVVPYAADQSAGIIGRLPSGMADGLYSVGYVVDAGDAIDEISETNNSAFAGTLRVGPAPANSGTPDDVEPNDAFSSATNLGTLGQASFTTGSISTTTDDDYFVFTAAESGQATITVSFSDNVGDIDATLTNAAGNTLDSGTSTNDDEVLTASVVEGEQYFIRVYGWSGAINTYGLDVNAPGVDTEGPVLATASFDRDATQQVRFTFDELIDPSAVSAGDLVLENLSTGEVFNVSTLAFAVGGREATWAVSQGSPLLGNGVWEATLPGTSVTDINGNNAAGDASFTFDVLAGDANFDRTVDLADFGILRANFGSTNSLFAQGDFNYDGSVDLADFGLLRSSFGQTLGMPGSLFADDEA